MNKKETVMTTKEYHLPKGYSLLQVLLKTGAFLKNPVNFVEQSMEKFGDSYSAVLPGNRQIMWTRNPDFIDHVLRVNQKNYKKSEFSVGRASDFFGKGLVFANGQEWRRNRRLIQPAFHRKKLMGLHGIMIKTIQDVLAEMPTQKPIDIYPFMGNLTFKVLVNSLFDISLSEELLTELNDIFDQIIDELLVLLFAGFETTSNTLSWLLFLLADNTEVKEKLVASLEGKHINEVAQNEYLKATINEAMRLYPAAWMSERIAIEDDTLGEYRIPAETHIMIFFYGVHRNEKLWNAPDEFQPERFLKDGKTIKAKGFFPFGTGPRMCIGNHFALAEIAFFVHAFFEKFDVETTGQIPKMNPLLTLQPDKVMLKVRPVSVGSLQ